MSTAPSANVRVLELFVELLGAQPGRTKAQLRALPGYRGLADDAFETQFQRDKDALRDAGVAEADVMVAATGDDKANLVISLLAKTEFAVPRVVTRLNNPKNVWLFDQAWGVDVSVSTPRIMTSLVEEAVSVGIPVRLFSFNTAAVSMHALILPDDSPVVGKRVHSLELPPRSVLAALLRDGRPITPSADDVFEAADELLLLVPDADAQELTKLRQLVASPEPEASSEDEE